MLFYIRTLERTLVARALDVVKDYLFVKLLHHCRKL